MLKIRTGYSFRAAAGKIENVLDRLQEIGMEYAPITDRASTFGFYRWKKAAEARGMRPVFGVELAVTTSINAKKPASDYFTFIARDSLEPINRLVTLATTQFRYQPLLTLEQALEARHEVAVMTGHRPQLDWEDPIEGVHVMLGPSTPVAVARRALKHGWAFAASSDNRFPTVADKGFYEVLCGRNAETQTYPQWILDRQEWEASVAHLGVPEGEIWTAWKESECILSQHSATIQKSSLPKFQVGKTLGELCVEGAEKLGVNLQDEVYAERLRRELALIYDKGYEDYFHIVQDLVTWARSRMIVGPARGSSCGSLVCYLLGITTVDPIPFGLIFERFVDINRSDMPDIDIDFSDQQRSQVFRYITDKYGREHVARLGTVAMFQPRSALSEVGMALGIPKWKCDAVAESMIERSSGDSRALNTLEDTLKTMPAGKRLLEEHPEASVVSQFEGHPRHASQHAAGVVISAEPIVKFVAMDHRTGSIMADKKDAEDGYNLLKIDALGLTQLSVFEDALELAGLPLNYLEGLPLDDMEAFAVLNEAKWSGIFQFNGQALQSITKQFTVDRFDDIVSVTALGRPGPLASGGAHEWIRRRNGINPVVYPHPVFEPYLKDTLGIVIYQETVMEIGRNIGDLSWEQVTLLRKAMSKSLGKEYFDQFGDPWKAGAIAKGIPPENLDKVWSDLCAYGAWCLAADTEIRLAFANGYSPKTLTIEQLYEKYEQNPSPYIRQQRRKPVLISLDASARGRPQKSLAIIKSGIKCCWKYTFDDGSIVKCTPEHEFIINGEWAVAGSSKIGDEFTSLEYEPPEYEITVGKGHNKGKKYKEAVKGFQDGEGNPSWVNGITKFKQEFCDKMIEQPCEDCAKYHPRMEAHHNDFNSGKDRPSDLTWLCPSCHKKRHYASGRVKQWHKGYLKSSKRLVDIEYIGELMTYDISMPEEHNFMLANGIVAHNSFNKSHSVAYGLISYCCCWLKAHHPFEFAAATLSHENDPMRQIQLLREMHSEGFDYVPIDPELSGRKWTVGERAGRRYLVGPLHNVRGIGPKMVSTILGARGRGEPLPDRARKLLTNPVTDIDSLWPIRDGIARVMPDPLALNIVTHPTPIIQAQPTAQEQEFLFFCTFTKINPRDENEVVIVARRGYEIKDGNTTSLNLQGTDDTDTIFMKIDRWKFEKLGKPIVDRGRVGKALYAVKGKMRANAGFRMIMVSNVRYLGDLDKSVAPETRSQGHNDVGENAGVAG